VLNVLYSVSVGTWIRIELALIIGAWVMAA
jgi:hypothetical protein